MSLLRPSVTGRLLRAGSLPSFRSIPSSKRFDSRTAVGTPLTTSDSSQPALTTVESPKDDLSKEGHVRNNQPDYSAEVDSVSSTFSPIPKRVMNGSEEGEVVAAAVLSGAPIDLQARTVRIYKPAKPATQQGEWHGNRWRMDWDILSKGHRWENPLMGWQSSADYMQGTNVNFKTKEDAIRFAEKQGYEYFVQEPAERKIAPKAYANNFLWSDKKLKHIRTK